MSGRQGREQRSNKLYHCSVESALFGVYPSYIRCLDLRACVRVCLCVCMCVCVCGRLKRGYTSYTCEHDNAHALREMTRT